MFSNIVNDETTKMVKQFVLFSLIFGGLRFLGGLSLNYLPSHYLTSFFVVIRSVVEPFDFLLDTDTLFRLFGYVLAFQVGVWTFRAYIAVASFFNQR